MMFALRRCIQVSSLYPKHIQFSKMSQVGESGSGAGKAAGDGKKEAKDSFEKIESAREDEFFHRKQREQLKNLKAKTETSSPEKQPKK